jgi:hypothetical protein
VTQDFGNYLVDEWHQVFPIAGTALLGSALIASIGVAIAAYTPHRAFATVGIVVAFVLPIVVAGILVTEIDTAATRYAVFASPMDIIDGFTAWMFDAPPEPDTTVESAGYELWPYAPVALAFVVVAAGILVRRYRKVQA